MGREDEGAQGKVGAQIVQFQLWFPSKNACPERKREELLLETLLAGSHFR